MVKYHVANTQSSAQSLKPPLSAPELTRSSTTTFGVDKVALVVTECITITSAMRKHTRWTHSSGSRILGDSYPKAPSTRRVERVDNAGILNQEDMVSSRWAMRGNQEEVLEKDSLLVAFSSLRSNLKNCKNIRNYDTTALLHPFLQVVRSSSTPAQITSLALIAITKFLSYNVISLESPRLAEAMELLSSAIAHCRFEATTSANEETVLLQILNIMESTILSPEGEFLGDDSVCEMMETVLSMACQLRLSVVLRQSAEMTMVSICQVVFERWKYLELQASAEPEALHDNIKAKIETLNIDASKLQTYTAELRAYDPSSVEETQSFVSVDSLIDGSLSMKMQTAGEILNPILEDGQQNQVRTVSIKPYSLPSIRKLLIVLTEMIDPHNKQTTNRMRIIALRILDVAFEIAGPSIINHAGLANLAKDTLCRYLFQLIRSNDMALLNHSLCVCRTLLTTCRNVLRLQQELFLSYVVACGAVPPGDIALEPNVELFLFECIPELPRVLKPSLSSAAIHSAGKAPSRSMKNPQDLRLEDGARTADAREAIVESLSALIRIPSFMVELFVNYDCDVDRRDLCSDMVRFLSRNTFTCSDQPWSTVSALCLDSLLSYVESIADRLEDAPNIESVPGIESLRHQRSHKIIIMQGASKFNENPKDGLCFLVAQGIIQDLENPREIAKFLKETTAIEKKTLGDFISKKTNENILREFMKLFNFAGKRIDEATRELLGAFRLPGESALIERIMEVFAAQYMDEAKPAEIADSTAAFVLVYATILLNTDQHNPNFKGQKRMAIENFAQNLRGVNDGRDFDIEFLQEIFNSIRTREIILPEEHNDDNAYDHAWQEMIVKAESTPDLIYCNTNTFDADMFAATWKPIVASLSYVFMSATDEAVILRVITGFDHCAHIAAKYGLSDLLDRIVACLSHITTLAPEVAPNTSLKIQVKHENNTLVVSETAVQFGRNDRGQMAMLLLCRILNGNECAIRDGWEQVLRILRNLFVNSLMPSSFAVSREPLELPPIPLQSPTQIINEDHEVAEIGLIFAFTSYVSSLANAEPLEPSDQEIEHTLCAIDTISACLLDEIASNVSKMSTEGLKALFTALLSQLSEDISRGDIVVTPNVLSSSPINQSHDDSTVSTATYDPSIVFILELLTILTLQDCRTIEVFGRDTANALQNIINDAGRVHPIIVSRVVYYLLLLLKGNNNCNFIDTPVLLHAFAGLDVHLLQACASCLLQGITVCIDSSPRLRDEITRCPDFWSIVDQLRVIPENAASVLRVVDTLVSTVQTTINTANYEAIVQLLDQFATTSSAGLKPEHTLRGRRTKCQEQHAPKNAELNEMAQCGIKATTILSNLTLRVPELIDKSSLPTPEAWNAHWSPIFRTLIAQCLNPCHEVRMQGFELLQSTLLRKHGLVSAGHTEWTNIFTQVLFPIVAQLLTPEIYQSDPSSMSEMIVRVSTLLCRCYLHYLTELAESVGLLDLWLHIIDLMHRLLNTGQAGKLEEIVTENIKNTLLVMANGGYLVVSEEKPEQTKLWNETWKRMEVFLPHLREELFPGVGTCSDDVENNL
ncbi:Sec7-domain-containing protein [Penicillium paradoxum]|uniref:Sec7-domain-containing protein n=1 Tax=Penicillium paradoxum TaxID=176176 RepID=UPI0025466CA4|nr:Sec7-domain-containing protein [Penicillium paradoxum]KAJ5773671.1 Sec7-domain-containing protein [Penicillium paradoxum]